MEDAEMRSLALAAATLGLFVTAATAYEMDVAINSRDVVIKLAMGPVSAAQKKSGADQPKDSKSSGGTNHPTKNGN
jgi:hypothetical protein